MRKKLVCMCVCARWAGVGDVCYRREEKMLRKKFPKRGGQKQHSPKKVQQDRKQVTCVTREAGRKACVRDRVGSRDSEGGAEGRPATVSGLVPEGPPLPALMTFLLNSPAHETGGLRG